MAEKALFQNDKDKYNASARKGSHTMYFSKSGKLGETWVSLIEKAYAKLYGDYASLSHGYVCFIQSQYTRSLLISSSRLARFVVSRRLLDASG